MPAKKRSRAKPQSPPKPKIEAGGDVRVNYVKDAGLKVAVKAHEVVNPFTPPVPPPIPPSLIPTGKLEVNKEYKLKGGMFAMVTAKLTGSDPGRTPTVSWKKGHTADDHSFAWSPSIQAPERHVEDFIFNNLEET